MSNISEMLFNVFKVKKKSDLCLCALFNKMVKNKFLPNHEIYILITVNAHLISAYNFVLHSDKSQ